MSRELLAQLQRQSGDIPFVEELQEAISESPSAIFSFMPSGWVADGGANRMSPLEGIGLKLSKKPIPEELGYRETQYTLFGKPAAMRGDKREAKLVTKKASGRRRSTESAGDGKQDAEAAAAVIAAGSQITSLGFYNPAKESLPYGFEEIKKGIMGDKYDADVFNSRNDGLRIIVRRSASAFISQVGLTLDNELPNLAPGIAPVRRTIAGTPADVEEGMYLCFRKNPARALSRFRGMPGGADGAVFAACLFSGEPDVVSGMLEALSLLDYDSLPGPVMNELIAAIAEEGVTMAFTTNTEFVDSYLRHLGYLLIKGLGLISVATIVKVLVMCYQLRPFQSAEELQAMLMRRASRTTTLGDLKSFQLASFCEKDVKGGRAAAKTNALVGGLGFAEAKSQGDGSTAAAAKPRKTQSADAKSSRIAAIPEDGSAAIAEEGGETSGSAGAEETKAAAPPKADAAIRSLCARNISRIIQRIEIGRPEPPQFEAKGSLVKAMNAFFREGDLDAEFYTALRGATKGIMGRSEKIFAGLVLTFCKLSGAQADPNSPTTTKRRLFALKALRGCLASQVSADMSPNMKTLIKLFVVQALVNCAAVDAHHSFSPGDPSMCKEVLKCVLLITNSFKDFMAPQIGVLIENLVLPLLSSQYVSVSHKHDVISMLTRTMSSHEAVVNVYYNFDNHYYGRKVFEKTMAAVSKVADADGEKASAEMQSLQRAALQFLVQILGLLAKRADLYEDELAAATANTINPKLLK